MTGTKPTKTSTELETALTKRIAKDGPITVADYMAAAAETYYARGRVFGKDGDFITSPEISQVFGELIGLWCVTAWQAIGQPRNFMLVECGPGRGTLMADALRTVWDIAPVFARSASLHLIERSAALREEQRQTLRAYDVEWHDDLSSLPDGPLILIANEFLDALPIAQFVKTASGWCERTVTHDGDGFAFGTSPLPDPKVDDTFDDAADGSILEHSDAVHTIIQEMAALCVERPGVALLIDYGHVTTSVGDTLQAVKNHRYHPVLQDIGEADLTAHVDFAAVTESARSCGASVHGPVEQGLWLKRLGVQVRLAQLSEGKSVAEIGAIRDSVARLTAPDGMGALFKVLALGPPDMPPLSGFQAAAV